MSEWMESPYVMAAGAALVVGLLAGVFRAGRWYGAVNSDREAFKDFMKGVRDDLGAIRASIERILHRLPAGTVAHTSPLALTELGREVSEELDARGWAERTAPEFAERTRGEDPYTVQETCFEAAAGPFDADLEAKIRSCAYERGLEREQVVKVLAIELRDRLPEARSEQQG